MTLSSEAYLKGLMLASLDGDAAAYRLLLDDLRRRLLAYLVRRLGQGGADTEDLVQETLIAIHNKRATYDRAQPLTAWVYAIARYKLVDHYRRGGRRVMVPLDDAGELFVADRGGEAEARIDVERALATLPERTRELVRGVKLREDSVAEVAARAGMSESAVKVAVHRGLRGLSARLRGEGGRDD